MTNKKAVKNTTNWQNIIGFLGFILACISLYQSSKIGNKEDLVFTPKSELLINHGWGNITLMHSLYIINNGDANGTFDKITLHVLSADPENRFHKVLNAITYVHNGESLNFLKIDLRPDDIFVKELRYSQPITQDYISEVTKFQQLIDSEYKKKLKWTDSIGRNSSLTYASVTKFVNKRIDSWKAGKYFLVLNVLKTGTYSPVFSEYYEFTLTPDNINQLHNITKSIFDPDRDTRYPPVYVSLEKLKDKKQRDSLKSATPE